MPCDLSDDLRRIAALRLEFVHREHLASGLQVEPLNALHRCRKHSAINPRNPVLKLFDSVLLLLGQRRNVFSEGLN